MGVADCSMRLSLQKWPLVRTDLCEQPPPLSGRANITCRPGSSAPPDSRGRLSPRDHLSLSAPSPSCVRRQNPHARLTSSSMPVLRVILLWHQHQPFYKDLVTGEYRLPWTRLHALKDYYGMVKLLDEFPNVHQNFNLVPSLMVQIQDYVDGTARDPFLSVAAKPAKELSVAERRFALQYLFQANPQNLIGRYPRYRELWERFREHGAHPERAERYFQAQDFTDLQVLSQIAWFDEFFLEEKDVAVLVKKGHNYSLDDQKFVIARERELLARVLPAHADAAKKGSIEISATPFYHPILPLVCDTSAGARSEE